ncbi:MAG: DUF2561 family protein [Mycobacterium sp.]|nr:DUF2561 family protein [Mycobacterium sp.]
MASNAADSEVTAGRSPDMVDRIMVGVCGAIWLVLLAAGVIATVALVRLGSGHAAEVGHRQSSWLLYSIIVISALVILGAIPLLMRARRAAEAQPASAEVSAPEPPVRTAEAPTEKMRVFGVDPAERRELERATQVPAIPAALVDRIWLRGTTSLLAAMGLALIAVAVATYLLAVSSGTAAWVALGVAAVITVAMPAVLVVFQRGLVELARAGEA